MKGLLYLTWRYLRYRPIRSLLLIITVALMIYLPLAVKVIVTESVRLLGARAEETPLLVGPRGSATDLTLSSLYFIPQTLPPLEFLSYRRLQSARQGLVIPLHVRFHAGGNPLVGTTLSYFEQRELTPAHGRLFTRLGDCVIGAKVAEEMNLKVGESVISSPENLFDLAGVYPLKMRITGILERSHSPDDEAIFIDLKTAWVIEGLAHGHQDLTRPEAADAILSEDGGTIRANASVREYNEVTNDNLASFHFHGDQNRYPITSLIVFPKSPKDRALLLARFDAPDATEQILIPATALAKLANTLFATQRLVFYGFCALAAASGVLVILVFLLSLRLRESEMMTYQKIGLAPEGLLFLKISDLIIIVAVGAAVAYLAVEVTATLAPNILPTLL